MLDENALFYEKSLKLWEQLSHELNFNVMFSQRGVLNLANSDSQMDAITRRGNTMRLNGIDAELLDRRQVKKMIPYLDFSETARFQIKGGLLQRRGGTARHDAVAWGFARGADQLGVDIISEMNNDDWLVFDGGNTHFWNEIAVNIGDNEWGNVTNSIGKYITYIRNKDYWAINKPTRKYMYNFDSITIKYYKDMTVALEAFKAGEYDYILENHSKRWARDYNGPNFINNKIIKTELVHLNNTGIQGFAFNTRKDIFNEINLRKAITMVFDFEWSNKNLFYNQYLRSDSYFSNSELVADIKPSNDELMLVEKLNINKIKVKDKIKLPINKSPSDYRKSLIGAKKILDKSGYIVRNGQLYSPSNQPIIINFLLAQKGFERILAPFRNNLKRLGITLNYRTVDLSLYQQRLDNFEFDMTVVSYPQSQSPGSELMSMFSSESSDKNGAFNFPGIRDQDIDKLIKEIIYSQSRDNLITSAQLLDRILWNQYYMVPNWYINTHRVAFYDMFLQPDILPLYYQATNYVLQTWSMTVSYTHLTLPTKA